MRRDVRNYCPGGNSTVKCVKFLILHGVHGPHDRNDVNHWYHSIFSLSVSVHIPDGENIWRFLWFGSIRILPPESVKKKRLCNLVWILWNIRRLSQQIMIVKTRHITQLSLCEARLLLLPTQHLHSNWLLMADNYLKDRENCLDGNFASLCLYLDQYTHTPLCIQWKITRQ